VQTELAIGEVARRAGIQPSAIRYYERRGLLPAPERSSGRRRYDEDAVRRLEFIGLAKQAGFSLAEIRTLQLGFDAGVAPSRRWQALAGRKLEEIDETIARAERMRAVLQRGLECDCLSLEDCELPRTQARKSVTR
jgi:MerR family redox-sensitive transcriptional activator SoxR